VNELLTRTAKCGAPSEVTGRELSTEPVTYMIGDRKCIIEPVFNEDSPETIGTLLLKLMLAEDAPR
jgi:hypothetical protein